MNINNIQGLVEASILKKLFSGNKVPKGMKLSSIDVIDFFDGIEGGAGYFKNWSKKYKVYKSSRGSSTYYFISGIENPQDEIEKMVKRFKAGSKNSRLIDRMEKDGIIQFREFDVYRKNTKIDIDGTPEPKNKWRVSTVEFMVDNDNNMIINYHH